MIPDSSVLDRMAVDYLMWCTFVEEKCRAVRDPFVLTASQSEEIKRIAERLIALTDRTIALCAERPDLLDFFGFPPILRKMFLMDVGSKGALARIDCFLTPNGWKISEFNSDVPGGVHEGAAYHDLFPAADGFYQERYDVVPRFTNLVCRETITPTVGIIYATGYAEDLEQCQYLRMMWERQGIPAVLGSFDNITFSYDRLALFGHPLDILYRFFPAEWMEGAGHLIPFLNLCSKRGTRVINPFSQIVPQSKKIMAFWHEHIELFDAEERELIRAHVPMTRLFDPARMAEYLARRDEIVVKRGFGRIGEEVLMGMLHSDEEWREALLWPLGEPSEWIVQDRFEVAPAKIGDEAMYPCLGVYLVEGTFAGYFTRVAPLPFITYNAYEVPTWIEKS